MGTETDRDAADDGSADEFDSAFARWLATRVPLTRVRKADPPPDHDGYHSPDGRHRHKCERCGVVWEHETLKCPLRVMHVCPECRHYTGEFEWDKYFGPEPPAYHDPGGKTFRKHEPQWESGMYVVMYGGPDLAIVEVHPDLPAGVSFGGRTVKLSADVKATVDTLGMWSYENTDPAFDLGVTITKAGAWRLDGRGKPIGAMAAGVA